MAKVLYITANPKPIDLSYSLQLGDHFLAEYRKHNPNDTIEHVDLYKVDVPFIDGLVLGAWGKLAHGQELTGEETRVINRMDEILNQFLSADKYIFVTPLWNLSYPPMLKAYIDNILMAGKTFKYTEAGSEGLLKGKSVLHIQARGGFYSEGPAVALEFTNPYLKQIMAFIGITDYTHLYVEGMNATPDKANEILAAAKRNAEDVAFAFAQK
ncbi:FMN-dependent NADH-azoreductase [Aneurinibacillus terranovensis]|uniref:FMN-dependent NADH-azoreductase n=1 Tax=Aneurinibacillus terranovensis TaxID=278991 RepID=UPI000419E07E|nr:FMN-dependent NADH-azoreductase [Aneurinibacillus terranovensis]